SRSRFPTATVPSGYSLPTPSNRMWPRLGVSPAIVLTLPAERRRSSDAPLTQPIGCPYVATTSGCSPGRPADPRTRLPSRALASQPGVERPSDVGDVGEDPQQHPGE